MKTLLIVLTVLIGICFVVVVCMSVNEKRPDNEEPEGGEAEIFRRRLIERQDVDNDLD